MIQTQNTCNTKGIILKSSILLTENKSEMVSCSTGLYDLHIAFLCHLCLRLLPSAFTASGLALTVSSQWRGTKTSGKVTLLFYPSTRDSGTAAHQETLLNLPFSLSTKWQCVCKCYGKIPLCRYQKV